MNILHLIFFFAAFLCKPAEVFAEVHALPWQNDQIKINAYTRETDPQQILIKLEPRPGWHILWDNPGDLGTPVTFKWSSPVTRLNETVPQKFLYSDLFGQFGYENTVYYLFATPEKSLPQLELSWMACQDECLPQSVSLQIRPFIDQAEFTAAEATFPADWPQPINACSDNDQLVLQIKNAPLFTQATFIPRQTGIISSTAEQQKIYKNKTLEIRVDYEDQPFLPTAGLLQTDQGTFTVNITPVQPSSGLFLMIVLAFLGGIILNFMPCVFPVLSLKAFALTREQHKPGSGIQYTIGVLCCFLLMAALLYALRRGGTALGWGFQLQSPTFIGIMLGIFIIIFCLMAGIIKIRGRLAAYLGRFSNFNSFLTGFFAVLIASPCSGPLLGAAVGYALLQKPSACFPVFLSMGLGFALPFALVDSFPAAFRRLLPAPGHWMVYFNKILSIPVLLTCLWLGWLLYHQLKPAAVTAQSLWQPYNTARVEQLHQQHKPVFINFTAKWCLTCLLNKTTVLDTQKFQQLAEQCGLTLFEADWTEQDPGITAALAVYNRASVPLYVYYPPDTDQPVILPQLLTFAIINQHISDCQTEHDK